MKDTGLYSLGVGTTHRHLMTGALFKLLSASISSDQQDLEFWILINSTSKRDEYKLVQWVFCLSLPRFSKNLVMNYPTCKTTGTTLFASVVIIY